MCGKDAQRKYLFVFKSVLEVEVASTIIHFKEGSCGLIRLFDNRSYRFHKERHIPVYTGTGIYEQEIHKRDYGEEKID